MSIGAVPILFLWGCVPDESTGLDWVERIGDEEQPYAAQGLESRSYRMRDGFEDPEGHAPIFHVIRPLAEAQAAPRPVLLWLHGSAIGIEGDPERGKNCGRKGVEAEVNRVLAHRAALATQLARLGWTWVIPEDPWCDLWAGRGDEDPVDTGHHGAQFLDRILDALEEGFDDNQLAAGRLYGWGTSIGGMGILHFSASDGRFAAVVSDSGPVDPLLWYQNDAAAPALEHILGGPPTDAGGLPTEWYPNYARLSAPLRVQEGGELPIFVVYNTDDKLVPVEMNQELVAALQDRGGRWASQDLAHRSPAPVYHVQTGRPGVPGAWVDHGAFAFLEGKSPLWLEAEAYCPDCPLAPDEAEAVWSGGLAVQQAGAGLFFEAVLPTELGGKMLEVLPAAVAEGAELRLSLSSAAGLWASNVLSSEQFSGEEGAVSWVEQLQNTSWRPDADGDGEADPLPSEPLTLRVESRGGGPLSLDAILLLASSPD